MHVLAAIVAIFSVVTAVIGATHGDGIILLLAATGLLCAYTTFADAENLQLPAYLRGDLRGRDGRLRRRLP